MRMFFRFASFVCILAALSARSVHAQDDPKVPYSDCVEIASNIVGDLNRAPKAGETPNEAAHNAIGENVDSFLKIAKHITCFASEIPTFSRTSALKAMAESFSNSKQQSNQAGSSGTTSSVSKPAGSTSLIQDVGGVSATSNGSALTFQFAPGDLVQQLASAGVIDFCTSTIKSPKCTPTSRQGALAPATFSVTANTTSPGTSVTGTAAGSGTAVPVTLNSLSDTLTFGGVTAKYAFLYKNRVSSGTANNTLSPADTAALEAKALGNLSNDLSSCIAYGKWQSNPATRANATQAMTVAQSGKDSVALYSFVADAYKDLYAMMGKDPTCKKPLSEIHDTLSTVSAYQAAIAAQNNIATSKTATPLLGIEYDFTTPANKPSYHSAKLNFSWQSEVGCNAQVEGTATKALKTAGTKATSSTSPLASCPATGGASKATSTTASPTWTISASGGADIYTDAPSSTIPSASRLRDVQAGAEITFVTTNLFKNSLSMSNFFSKVGDPSVVFAYYYQDQTSPSILNGPPSTITFNGLPTTASQVFAARGPINVGQVRLGFGTGSNLRFPIAVSYSNRSDLIVHPFVGVQFGLSYDLFGK
jgi:hypothetical protein